MSNFFEGFSRWLNENSANRQFGAYLPTTVGIDAKYAAEQDLILSNVNFQSKEGKPIQFPGVSHWKIIKSDPSQKWVRIKNVDFTDSDNRKLNNFPQGFNPSNYAGREFTLSGEEFNKLLAPRATGGAPTGPGGMLGMGG